MDDSLYDEFGNYIGPELRSSDEEDASESEAESEPEQSADEDDEREDDREAC